LLAHTRERGNEQESGCAGENGQIGLVDALSEVEDEGIIQRKDSHRRQEL